MNKKITVILVLIALAVVPVITVIALYNSFIGERPSNGENPEQIFINNVAKLEDGDLVELKELAAFDWDIMYMIMPYSDAQRVNERHSLNIRSSPRSFNTDLLFIKGDELVTRISGGRHREVFSIYLPIHPLIYYYSESYYFSVQKTRSLVVLYRGDSPRVPDNEP